MRRSLGIARALLLVLFVALWFLTDLEIIPIRAALGLLFVGALIILGWQHTLTNRQYSSASSDAESERYQAFVATSSEAIWCIEIDPPMPDDLPIDQQVDWIFNHGTHSECNAAFLEIYGFTSKSDVIGLPLQAIFPRSPNNEALILDFVRDGFSSAKRISHDVDPDGKIVYTQNSAIGTVENGFLQRVWGMQIDVGPQLHAAEKLEQSERLLAESERLARIGSWSLDPNLGTMLWSSHLYRIIGTETESFEPSLEHWTELIVDEDRLRWRHALLRTLDLGRRMELELRIVRPDGELRHLLVRAECLHGDEGELKTVLGVVQDISQRRQIEKKREELEAQVFHLQKLEAIGTLAGGIAHDFNNILSASMGFTELALSDVADEHPAKPFLYEIDRANLRAKDLVGQILSFSRRVERKHQAVELRDVIEEALALLRASLPASLKIERRLVAGDTEIFADASQIHQVLLNLCTNASHAMLLGGVLRIELDRVRLEEKRHTAISTLEPDDYLCLSVIDSGLGMDEATRQRIFDAFFTTKAKGEGTGLGLSTVQAIVLGHGGGVEVRSEPGHGTTFLVYFPCAEKGSTIAFAESKALVSGQGQTVLLVDDEETLVRLGQGMFERLGYQVVALTSAEEALRVFDADVDRFDLLVTDWRMPVMSGLELTAEIQQRRPGFPIVILTGFPGPEVERHKKEGKIFDYLVKPLRLQVLAECAARALERSQAEERSTALARVESDG